MSDGRPADPRSPKERFLGAAVLITIILAALAISVGPELRRSLQRKALLTEGVDATATIVDLRQTGRFINENPEVEIQLLVQPQSGQAYQAEVRQILTQVEIADYRKGTIVSVKVDPAEPSKLVIVARADEHVLVPGS